MTFMIFSKKFVSETSVLKKMGYQRLFLNFRTAGKFLLHPPMAHVGENVFYSARVVLWEPLGKLVI
jgi:hypothetical protein